MKRPTPSPTIWVCSVALVLALGSTTAQAADYHHVHLTASPAENGARWYIEHMGCQADAGVASACRCGSVELFFIDREPEDGSVGTGVDHIGFSVRNLPAKMIELEAAGVRILEPLQERALPLAYVEDPWGTRIEVTQDPDVVGFHHVHLLSATPEATTAWYEEIFGGIRRDLPLPSQPLGGPTDETNHRHHQAPHARWSARCALQNGYPGTHGN